jgi:thioredoxin reductase
MTCTHDVIVVGGGPAGLSAAIRLKKEGVPRVLVLERQGFLGGIPMQCDHLGFGIRHRLRLYSGPGYARTLAREAQKLDVEALTSTTVLSLDARGRAVSCVSPAGHATYRARAILLATGCRESTRAALKIPGFRGPGVINTSQAQQFLHEHRAFPGKRAVVFGSENVGMSVVWSTWGKGFRVVAMVEERRHLVGYRLLDLGTNKPRGVPLYTGHTILRIVGRRRVEGVEIAALGPAGQPIPGTARTIACDAVICSGRFVPENELLMTEASGGLSVDARTRGPVVDQFLQTDAPGVFAAGNLLHPVETGDICGMEGDWAGRCVARWLADPASLAGEAIEIRPGRGIQWVLPQRVRVGVKGGEPPPRFLPSARATGKAAWHRLVCRTSADGGAGSALWRTRPLAFLAPERRLPHPARALASGVPGAPPPAVELAVDGLGDDHDRA